MPKSEKELKVMREFADRFCKLAAEHDPDLSNKALGKQLAVSDTSIFKWKNAQAVPSVAHACLIALRYKVSVDWLLTGRKDPTGTVSEIETLSQIIDELSPESFSRLLQTAEAFLALEKQKQQ